MRRLLAGMLFLVIGAFAFAPAANAAEIPPTAECTKLMKELLKGYSPERYEKLTKKQQEAVDRHMVNRLFEADCVSDVEPILNEMPTRPFSESCEVAAKGADKYWTSLAPAVIAVSKKWRKATKTVRLRQQNVIKRIRKLRRNGASAKRVAPLVRLRKALHKRGARISRPYVREMFKIYRTYGYNTFLIMLEFMSLRCIEKDSSDIEKAKGPAARVLEEHAFTVFFAMIILIDDEDWFSTSGSSASNGASASSSGLPTDAQLPLINLP